MTKKKNIIFGYSFTPSYGCFGESDGGFSVELYADGNFVYKTYIFDHNEREKISYKLPVSIAEEITEELTMNRFRLNSIPNRLENGSLDGYCNCFIFLNKEIMDYNIGFNDEEEIKKQNPAYFEAYKDVIMQENFIIEIFDKVVEKLKCANVEMTLHSVDIKN